MLLKKKASLAALIVLSLITVGLAVSSGITVSSSLLGAASSPPAWSSLRGVNYQWEPLGECSLVATPSPSVSFPMLKAEGFNLIRVEFGVLNTGQVCDPANFFNNIQQIATQAQANGLYVIYNQHHTSAQSDVGNFQDNWNQVWQPLLKIVDSNPSTLGYEPVNEPTSSGWSTTTLQQYYQFIANNIRSYGSTKAIVMMGQGGADMGYGIVNSQDLVNLEPKGISNIVLDFHNYQGANLSASYFNSYASASKALGNVPVWIGEWAYDHSPFTVASSQIPSIIQNYEKYFKTYGFANTYWKWADGGSGPWSMLNTNGQPQSWVKYIVQYQGTTSTTTTTSNSQSSRSTTTGGLSSSTLSSSSSSSSTIVSSSSSSSFTSSTSYGSQSSSSLASSSSTTTGGVSSFISTSSSTNTSTQNSSSTHGHNGRGQGQGKGLLTNNSTSSSSSITSSLYQSTVGLLATLSPTKDPPVAFGLATYELFLFGGLGFVVMAFRRRREIASNWRW